MTAIAPEVWAVPLSRDAAALWTVLPASASEVAMIHGPDAETSILFKRRIIVPGHRVHLIVSRVQDVAQLAGCMLAFRPSHDQPVERHDLSIRLADWRSPAVGMVVHAIVDGVSEHGGGGDLSVFARALAGMSTWTLTADRHATHDGISLATFDFCPPDLRAISAIRIEGGALAFGELSPAYGDESGCCLLWEGAPFEQAFLELDGELIELRIDRPSADGRLPLPAWFAEMKRERLDRILDAWLALAGDRDADGMDDFATLLPTSREAWLGEVRLRIAGAFSTGRTLVVSADVPVAATMEIELPDIRQPAVALEPAGIGITGGGATAPVLYRAPIETGGSIGIRAARLRITCEGASRSLWIALRPLTAPDARRAFHAMLDWDTAGDAIVADLAAAAIRSEAALAGAGHAIISLGAGAGDPAAPVVICPLTDGSLDARATLLAMRLSLGCEAVLRLICRERPAAPVLQELRSFALDIGGPVELVVCEPRRPIGPAMTPTGGEGHRAAVMLVGSGLFPRDADWWPKLCTVIKRNPRGVFWRSPTNRPDMATAVEYRLEGVPFVVLGPRAGFATLCPTMDVFSFEGFVRHILWRAEAENRAVALSAPRIVSFSRAARGDPRLGDVRLDDAIFDAARGSARLDVPAGPSPVGFPRMPASRGLRAS